MVLMILSLCLSLLLGYLLVLILLPQENPVGLQRLCGLSMGMICGLGVSSCCFFICYILLAPSIFALVLTDLGVHLLLIGLFLFIAKTRRKTAILAGENKINLGLIENEDRLSKIFALMCLVAFATFVLIAMQAPYGGHDAMGIWNLRARILALPQDSWLSDLKNAGYHPDYPLMLGASIGRVWMYAGQSSTLVPISIHFLITFSTVFLLVAAVWRIKALKPGIIAGMILVGTPFFLRDGAEAQQADVALSFFVLATMFLLVWKDLSDKKSSGLLTLAGLNAGLAAWTKNEGILFLLGVAIIRFGLVAYFFGLKDARKEMKYLGLGLAPVLLVLIYFKTQIAPTSDLIAAQRYDAALSRLTDFPRYLQILKAFITEMLSFSRWQIYPFALGAYLYFSGVDLASRKKKLAFFSVAGIIATMLTGYYLVYLTTYLDLHYHIRTSLSRILLHLWPLTLFAVFLIKKDDPIELSTGH